MDIDLSQQIERGQIYICENYYHPEDVEITSKFIVFLSILSMKWLRDRFNILFLACPNKVKVRR